MLTIIDCWIGKCWLTKIVETIKNAVIEDTINYNQQTFLYDETGKVLVDVYKAVKERRSMDKR